MSDTIYSIYRLTSTTSNKFYIGYTQFSVQKRFKEHCNLAKTRPTTHLHKAINKYGKSDFIVECLYQSKNKDDILSKEEYFIREYNSISESYNMTTGGEGGVPTDDVRKKLSENNAMKNPIYRKKVSEALKGHSYTPSEKHLQHLRTVWIGRKHSEESKKKMSENNPMNDPKNREKISLAKKGVLDPKIQCPYCHKSGGNSGIKRWHFENCKQKI